MDKVIVARRPSTDAEDERQIEERVLELRRAEVEENKRRLAAWRKQHGKTEPKHK